MALFTADEIQQLAHQVLGASFAISLLVGILIHRGNTNEDTLGCILVGMVPGADHIGQSSVAWDLLWPKLKHASDAGEEISITIHLKCTLNIGCA